FLSGRVRLIAVGLAALAAGPKILLLFPIWLFGVLAHKLSQKAPISNRIARLLFARSSASIVVSGAGYGLQLITGNNFFSSYDYLLGAAVAVNLYAASFAEFSVLSAGKRAIGQMAGMTFSLYLFHDPLLRLFAALIPNSWSDVVRGPILLAFTF